jgi:hypothetical protein
MPKQLFLFNPGNWIGQGKITFSHAPGHLRFYTKWIVHPQKKDAITADQQIEQEGGGELLINTFQLSAITESSFDITLSNALTGVVEGKGLIHEKSIAWEFRRPANFTHEIHFEGFEVYELQENGDYMLHAEYFSGDQFRTTIDGRIWKKS